MGGTLGVESKVGKGSRFFFQLQMKTDGITTTVEGIKKIENVRVLIVDDNKLSREVMQMMAKTNGWESESVDSGEQALLHLQEVGVSTYDIIFMDWHMPGIDALDTTRRIRGLATDQKIAPKVIMVTSHGVDSLLSNPLLNGSLVKPITASMMLESVVEVLGGNARSIVSRGELIKKLCGLRLLVVDDNILNQQVAKELLQNNGAIVRVASGGREATMLALSADIPCDAILMDIQMPDIDGLEETRQIREHSKMLSVPMTANAMQSDKDSCIEVGMVDYINKPIILEEMILVIQNHTNSVDNEFVTDNKTVEVLI
jgi:CheY-like chemotaxis protein